VITDSHDLREKRPLVVQRPGNSSQGLQLCLHVSFAHSNIVQVIADLGEVVGELVGEVEEVSGGAGDSFQSMCTVLKLGEQVVPLLVDVVHLALHLAAIGRRSAGVQDGFSDIVEPVLVGLLLSKLLLHHHDLAQLVLDHPRVGGDWSQNVHELALGVQPVIKVVMDVVEVLELIEQTSSLLALVLQLLPADDDLVEVIVQDLCTWGIWFLLQQVLDVHFSRVKLSLVLVKLVKDAFKHPELFVGLPLV